MSNRELVALGTSSQVPTRERSHNAYMLLWDGEGFLFDPGEGAQRQLVLANIPSGRIHHICITHFHGDHCLGLAGILQRLSLDQCRHSVHIHFPEGGQEYIHRMEKAAVFQAQVDLILHPVAIGREQMVDLFSTETWTLKALSLEHSIPTLGYRLEESGRRRFVPELLDSRGIRGERVGELRRNGFIEGPDGVVRIEDVTVPQRGSIFAFVMDTRFCKHAVELARDADLLVMESTYTTEHQNWAGIFGHSSAVDAARTASEAGALRLALTHFSQRYPDTVQHLAEAGKLFPQVIALNDLDRVEIPRRA